MLFFQTALLMLLFVALITHKFLTDTSSSLFTVHLSKHVLLTHKHKTHSPIRNSEETGEEEKKNWLFRAKNIDILFCTISEVLWFLLRFMF